MQILTIKLYNIRTYKTQTINFPTGLVLLTGDIGSGKSTLLMAIEFALFGLIRGSLKGNELLRYGSKEGFVELTFIVDSEKYTISRTLKRKNSSITQNNGYIITKNGKKILTPLELKACILKILGYPKNLITKNKGLLFRYTLYSPQEEMKEILNQSSDLRLDTLRKIFLIDKYKQVKSNILIYARNIRSELKIQKQNSQGIEELKNKIIDINKKLNEKSTELSELLPKRGNKKDLLDSIKNNLGDLELRLRKVREQDKIKQTVQMRIKIINNSIKESMTIEKRLIEEIKQEQKFDQILIEDIEIKKDNYNKRIYALRQTLKNGNISKGEKLALLEHSKSSLRRLLNLGVCPTCKQIVSEDYKKKMQDETENKMIKQAENIKLINERNDEIANSLKKLDEEIQKLQEKYQLYIKQESINRLMQEKRRNILKFQEKIKSEKEELIKLKIRLNNFLEKEDTISLEKEYDILRKDKEKLQSEERNLSIEIARLNQYIISSKKLKDNFVIQLKDKENSLKEAKYKERLDAWITKTFNPLLDQIEVNVFASIHQHFSIIFAQWFQTLVDDDIFNVRLDESFSPLIQQNGHDVTYNQLSGGERTAAALAYRLALNSVINQVISNIKTKDILILDEPTDGFSADQLDRVRDVLHKLSLKQIIIVSHELKMEGYVNHIIRLQKENTVSTIVNT